MLLWINPFKTPAGGITSEKNFEGLGTLDFHVGKRFLLLHLNCMVAFVFDWFVYSHVSWNATDWTVTGNCISHTSLARLFTESQITQNRSNQKLFKTRFSPFSRRTPLNGCSLLTSIGNEEQYFLIFLYKMSNNIRLLLVPALYLKGW